MNSETNFSPNFSLNKTDIEKILKGAFFALSGAFLTYLADILPHVDFGSTWSPIVAALLAILMNTAHKWLSAKSYPIEKAL